MAPPPGMMPPGMMAPPPAPEPDLRAARVLQRLKPFTLPEREPLLDKDGQPRLDDAGNVRYKTPRKPSKKYILDQKEQRTTFWKGRNEEIDKDLAMILMESSGDSKAGAGKGGEEDVRLTTAPAMIYKMANLVSRQEDSISVTPRSDAAQYADAAQDIEDWLLDCRREIDAKHTARGMQGYAYAETWLGGATGWIVSREYLDPGRRWPICSELFDPQHCYPEFSDNDYSQLSSMLYYEQTSRRAFLSANPRFRGHQAFERDDDGGDDDENDEDDDIEVIWYEDEHWSAVMIDDRDPVYVEHAYGFCPWLAIPISGSPLMDDRNRRHHGMSIIRMVRAILHYQDRLASQIATIVARAANPPKIRLYRSSLYGKNVPQETSLEPGVENLFDIDKGDGLQPIEGIERPDQVEYMTRITDQSIDNMGVPALLRGTQLAINSGFQFNVMRQNAEDVAQPMTKGIITHRQWQHRLWLQLILVAERDALLEPDVAASEGDEMQMGMLFRRPNRAPGAGAYVAGGTGPAQPQYVYSVLTPEAIHLHGVETEVRLSNMTPQDLAQNGQIAGMLTEMGVLDPETAASRLLGIHDWQKIRDKIIYYQFMKQPEVIQNYLGPAVLRYMDPQAYAYMLYQKEMEAQRAMLQQAPPPGAAPAPSPGLDSTVLPPQEQAVTGMPGADGQGLEALIASLGQQAPPGA